MLTPFKRQLGFLVAILTFQPQDLLLRSLGVLSENRLGLSTITSEFHMVSPLSQGFRVSLASFVLSNFVLGVALTFLVFAESPPYFRDVDHLATKK